jgi:hypothetical protein
MYKRAFSLWKGASQFSFLILSTTLHVIED